MDRPVFLTIIRYHSTSNQEQALVNSQILRIAVYITFNGTYMKLYSLNSQVQARFRLIFIVKKKTN